MFEVGRICVKIAGRDANKVCVVVDTFDNNFVLIDGETRRKKCNIKHLEPLQKTVSIHKGANHAEVKSVFETMGLTALETKPKKASEKPVRIKMKKAVSLEEKSSKQKSEAKTEKKKEKKEDKSASPKTTKKAEKLDK